MQRNIPGLSNLDSSNNGGLNSVQLSNGYPHSSSQYSQLALPLSNKNANFYNQSQKLQIESESVRSSYNPLRLSKGGNSFLTSMTPDASSVAQVSGSFSQSINQNQGNNFGQHLKGSSNGLGQRQSHQYAQQQMNQQQLGGILPTGEINPQYARYSLNSSNILNKEQNKSESFTTTQQILNTSNSNARNNSKSYSQKIPQKNGESQQNSMNFYRNLQNHGSAANSNNNSNNFQNMTSSNNTSNNQGSITNQNMNKLTIETSGETRPYSATNFTSYSATNSSAPMFGTKHTLVSSLNGVMTTKFNEKSSIDFSSSNHQLFQNSNNHNNPSGNLSYSNHRNYQQNAPQNQQQPITSHTNGSLSHHNNINSENLQQQSSIYHQNHHFNHISSQPQRHSSNGNHFQQSQITRDESPSIKVKQNNFMQTVNQLQQGQSNSQTQSQGNNSFISGQNTSNGFKKQLGTSINFKEGFQSYKQQEESKRLSKSIQGHEIQRVIQTQKQPQLTQQQHISQQQQLNQQQMFQNQSNQYTQQQQFNQQQLHVQQQQLMNSQTQQKLSQNNENINPYQQQQQQLKMQTSLTSSQQLSTQQTQNSSTQEQKQILKAQLTQNPHEPIIGKSEPLPNHEPTKCSFKRNGIVKAYAANTNQGLVRNYNEDRVSIILNIMKPASRANEQWPKCSFFGVYDGHGGVNCADFLRDNLHQFVIKESSFPWNPKEALRNGFAAAEKAFIELAQTQEDQIDRSGSCAIVILIVGDTCYVANVGDSRAVLSGECGQKVYTLSRDHKPTDELEQKRIVQGGGKIYQTHATQVKQGADQKAQTQLVVGPLRVFPGRLSVSRTFGDIEAKLEKYGGNPLVVVSEPEIKSFKITDDHDFIILASDGVYDKMTSKEVIQSVWNNNEQEEMAENIHKQCSVAVENILRDSLNKRSLDNVTVVMIAFNNYKVKLFGSQDKKNKQPLEERKNFQQPMINSAEYASHGNKLEYSSTQNQGNKTATASSSQHYNGDFSKFSDKDIRKSLNIATNSRNNTGELQLRKKFKENQIYNGSENFSYLNNSGKGRNSNNYSNNSGNSQVQINSVYVNNTNNMNQGNAINSQFNKLRLLDEKISEISNKVNQFSSFDRKMINNNR